MSELKDAGIMFRMIMQATENAGMDPLALLQRLGISPGYLKSRELRTPHSAQIPFWNAAEQLTGNPDIGLHLGQHLPVFRGQVLEYLFLSSPSFGEGLKRALNYQRLISDASDGHLVVGEDRCYLRITTASEEVARLRHFNECFVQGLIAFFRFVTEDFFQPEAIDFIHEAPENPDLVKQVLGCPVSFGQPENRLYFARSVLDHPSPHAEPELMALHEKLASEQVARLEKQDIIARVEKVIAELLESGEITIERIAQKLDIKPRALRTQLTDAGTSFNQILAEYRFRLARRLLADTSESIDEIVYLTGFSEPSTFYRAFKRWSGMTPIEYRKSRQQDRKPAS